MVHKVYLIGAGLGNAATLTLQAKDIIDQADLLIGAPRLLQQLGDVSAERLELVRSEEIAAALQNSNVQIACVLFSGDLGFYSGATRLREMLSGCVVESIPGVSSLNYLCAKIGVPWQDVHHVSAHGRMCNIAGEVQTHARTFCLTGGETKVGDACRVLLDAGLGDARVWVGERLSYPDERIVCSTVRDLADSDFSDLSVMLVENENPISCDIHAPSLTDSEFVRGDVPMTKEEVRALVMAKLRLHEDDVVWDVGAGTGSISVEAAHIVRKGSVYAVEKKADALDLLKKNQERFSLSNIRIVPGEAPGVLVGLPKPQAVFIGGSSGNLSAIVESALAANSAVRLCITAITLETLAECLTCIKYLPLDDVDIVQASIAKAKSVAQYQMMSANNPVYLISATGSCEKEEQA